jgi:hypothetical protein
MSTLQRRRSRLLGLNDAIEAHQAAYTGDTSLGEVVIVDGLNILRSGSVPVAWSWSTAFIRIVGLEPSPARTGMSDGSWSSALRWSQRRP